MASLIERLDKQIADLETEQTRIREDAATNLEEVAVKLATLAGARKAITKEVEAAYVALLKLGLISEVTR
jgi:hypothetical protein